MLSLGGMSLPQILRAEAASGVLSNHKGIINIAASLRQHLAHGENQKTLSIWHWLGRDVKNGWVVKLCRKPSHVR